MRDAFIPCKRRSRSQTKFGFVRINLMVEASKAIASWDGLGVHTLFYMLD